MTASENSNLSTETAEALLTAIKEAAPTASGRSTEGLQSLAEAYAAVVSTMPRKDRTTVAPSRIR